MFSRTRKNTAPPPAFCTLTGERRNKIKNAVGSALNKISADDKANLVSLASGLSTADPSGKANKNIINSTMKKINARHPIMTPNPMFKNSASASSATQNSAPNQLTQNNITRGSIAAAINHNATPNEIRSLLPRIDGGRRAFHKASRKTHSARRKASRKASRKSHKASRKTRRN